MRAASGRRSPVLVTQYIAVATVWGASFLFMKVAVGALSPAQVVLGRLTFGAIVLAAAMVLTHRRWPRGRRVWGHLSAIAALSCVIPFLLFSWAAQHLPSGLSSIYNATTPIATMVVGLALLPDERLSRPRTVGLFVAAVGVLVVAAPWTMSVDATAPMFLWAQAACLAATTCYGLGFTYTRRFLRGHGHDAVTVAAAQIGAGAVIMMLLLPVIGLPAAGAWSLPVAGSMLALGGIGTGVVYIWNTNIIQAWGATTASTVTYLTPVTGVVLGVLVLDEQLQWHELLGGAVIVAAVLLGSRRATPADGNACRPRSPGEGAPPPSGRLGKPGLVGLVGPVGLVEALRGGRPALREAGLSPALIDRLLGLTPAQRRELEEFDTPAAVRVEVAPGTEAAPQWSRWRQ